MGGTWYFLVKYENIFFSKALHKFRNNTNNNDMQQLWIEHNDKNKIRNWSLSICDCWGFVFYRMLSLLFDSLLYR